MRTIRQLAGLIRKAGTSSITSSSDRWGEL
jgi:hypothetical protein